MNDGSTGLRRRLVGVRASAEYQTEKAIDMVTEAIVDRMAELAMNRRQLAASLGVTPSRITSLLRGTNNSTLRSLVDVASALDCDLAVSLVPHAGSATRSARHEVAAESAATYCASRPASVHASRDQEIRQLMECGKLRVDGDTVLMRHDRDGSYRPAVFRKASTGSDNLRTNVGRRAYYRDRILAIAKGLTAE
jgi:transcriptional regulator with XRE-family HTH domain